MRDADTRKIPECNDVSVRFRSLVCPTRIARYLFGEDFVNFRAIGSCLCRAQLNRARIAQKLRLHTLRTFITSTFDAELSLSFRDSESGDLKQLPCSAREPLVDCGAGHQRNLSFIPWQCSNYCSF